MGIRIFNNVPPYIKDISNKVKKFENCLKQFLHIHSFYFLEEYFQHNLFTSWKCFHFSTIIIITLVKCVIYFCVSLTKCLTFVSDKFLCFLAMFVTVSFATMVVLCILLYKVFVPRLYPITLMYDLESAWFQRLM